MKKPEDIVKELEGEIKRLRELADECEPVTKNGEPLQTHKERIRELEAEVERLKVDAELFKNEPSSLRSKLDVAVGALKSIRQYGGRILCEDDSIDWTEQEIAEEALNQIQDGSKMEHTEKGNKHENRDQE